MKNSSTRTLLHRIMEYFTVVTALFLIPIALLISLFVPLTTKMALALIVLPSVVFASWLIKVVICGQLNRKDSPFFLLCCCGHECFVPLLGCHHYIGTSR